MTNDLVWQILAPPEIGRYDAGWGKGSFVMLSVRARWALASAPIVLALWSASRVDAEEAETRAAIVKLIEVGWAVTPQARIAADAQYQEVLKIAGRDPRALWASWLVLMQQRRFEDAR